MWFISYDRKNRQSDIHVLPIRDLKDHDESRTCWCHPDVQRHGRIHLVAHNAEDGRDLIERHGLQ